MKIAILAPVKVENMILGGGIIRSGGRTKYIMIIDILGTWLVGVPLGLFTGLYLKLHIRIPIVVYDGFMNDQGRINNITIDDHDGGKQAGEYFRKMGHKKVLCIADNDICMDLDRYNGFCEGFGAKTDFLKIPMIGTERNRFYEEILNQLLTYTGIFAVSDYYAIDLMTFLKAHNINVPDDISIIGFDGSDDCTKVVPALTSVSQNNPLRSKTAIEVLLKMINNPDYSDKICVPVKLIERDSIKKYHRMIPSNSSLFFLFSANSSMVQGT